MHDFKNDVCDNEHYLTHTHLITFMKLQRHNWLEEYITNKKNDDTAYNSLLRHCQRFTKRYHISQRVPCATKLPQAVLAEPKATIAKEFWEKFKDTTPSDIINVDETSVYYDMPPKKTLAKIAGQMYVVQEKAWMDTRVWEMYLTDLLKYEIEGPSVIVADNLDCHYDDDSHQILPTRARMVNTK
ncbi:hypothetical protein H310_09721 [Aphanomyces invadans]|uniref:DDE-1 domain-containing protein n=1 Tax=Aphanomyces invadans TaxID=157072 RepID=A0A024TVP8_9STRA|nr:hypothetical protein H310_09721 [Aphanomyces invadans]ETV97387.1 hypothetical protein H310_09721 [Aphanomyces invadans]|eukprot:XP_008874095.1 hypothetical protein H310_09721 [Aphanomyces invadans]